jgi:SAM-dependent methyltransferase
MPGLFSAYFNTTILYTKYHLFRSKFLPLLSAPLAGVEIGFGEGFYLWELYNHVPGISFTGFDISEHAIAFASMLFEYADIPASNYRLALGDINDRLPVEDESFDFGILAEVIEHIENPQKGLLEMARILKPGACLYLSTVKDSNHMDHITNFESPEAVESLLNDSGFTVADKCIYRIQDDFPDTKDISVGLAFVAKKR